VTFHVLASASSDVSVIYAQAGKFEHRRDVWHPHSRTSVKRFQIADFMYSKRADVEEVGGGTASVGAPTAGSSDASPISKIRIRYIMEYK
jgi:hypothetical protein